MKKVSLLVLCAVALGAFEPGIMAVPSKATVTNRLQSEYSQFKASMKCFKQKGWKGCTPAQRKRIAVAGVALTALIVAVVGGGTVLGLKRYKYLKKSKEDLVSKEEPVEEMSFEQWKQLEDKENYKQMVNIVAENPGFFTRYSNSIVNWKGKNEASILHQAALLKNKVAVQRLLDNKLIDVDVLDKSGNTPLYHAVLRHNNAFVVELLLDKGAAINAQNKRENTPLHYAADGGSTSAVKLLLYKGAEINARNKKGRTPLYFAAAAKEGTESVVELLLKRGATVSDEDVDIAKTNNIKGLLEAKIAEQQGQK